MRGARGVVVAGLLAAACGRREEPDAGTTAESLLFGGEACRENWECAAGRCSLGMCVGFLMSAVEAARLKQEGRLREAARDPAMRVRMVNLLGQVLADPEGDTFLRARAAQALSLLPAGEVTGLLVRALDTPEEAVRFQAARSLHRLGDSRGTKALEAFLQHDSAPVRALARYVLDHEAAKTPHGVSTR